MKCHVNSRATRALALLGSLLCAGCTTIGTKTPEGKPVLMNEEQFTAYVEHVFRHHNAVVNESLFVAPNPLSTGQDPLAAAEMQMHHACQPLNEVVSTSATGGTPDFMAKMKLAEAVPECEAATRRLEKMIANAP